MVLIGGSRRGKVHPALQTRRPGRRTSGDGHFREESAHQVALRAARQVWTPEYLIYSQTAMTILWRRCMPILPIM